MSISSPASGDALAVTLRRRRQPGEAAIQWALRACALISILTTVGIVMSLAGETINFFRTVPIGDFFLGANWAPTFGKEATFGVLQLVLGTLMVAVIGVLVAIPLGIGIAIYLSEYAHPRVRRILKPFLEILAGIPTVVLGFFALNFVTAVLLKKAIPGIDPFNSLAAGLVVGIMIVPTIASLSEDAMRAVPNGLREAAYGVGASKRRVALRVVLPAAMSGVMASVILGLSRAVGETLIVSIAGGMQPRSTLNPLVGHQTMTSSIVQISLGDTPAGSITYKAIFALGTTLFFMTLVLNSVSLRIVRRFRERYD